MLRLQGCHGHEQNSELVMNKVPVMKCHEKVMNFESFEKVMKKSWIFFFSEHLHNMYVPILVLWHIHRMYAGLYIYTCMYQYNYDIFIACTAEVVSNYFFIILVWWWNISATSLTPFVNSCTCKPMCNQVSVEAINIVRFGHKKSWIFDVKYLWQPWVSYPEGYGVYMGCI